MDVKVYKKEEVLQPSGSGYVYVPDIIDLIPVTVETESTEDITDNIWSLATLQRIADVKVEDGKLIINSDKVRYENGNLYVTLTREQILTCEVLEDDSHDLIEQGCALATIFQKGLDPIDLEDGIQWSETLLGETNVLQLMDQITEAVSRVSIHVKVEFSTTKLKNGQTVLSYSLKEVA